MLLETWCSDDEASLLRNVNNNKYGLVFQFNFSHRFVSHGFVVIFTWIFHSWNEIYEHEYYGNSCSSFSNQAPFPCQYPDLSRCNIPSESIIFLLPSDI